MVFLFYNKMLLRALVFLIGGLTAVCAWHYIGLSAQKLGSGGVRDALSIVSILIAGWLLMLIAEVVDNHYLRAFAALCYGLGAIVSYHWIFQVDAPKLAEMQGGGSRVQMAGLAFWVAAGLATAMLAVLITRLIIDKLSYGRQPNQVAKQADQIVGERQAGQGEPAQPQPLPPIPVDHSPFATVDGGLRIAPVPSAPQRIPGPVSRLRGTAGAFAGVVFELHPGSQTVGRQDADVLLDQDSQVSRQHASLEVGVDGLAMLRDLGSTNGTWVNRQRITELQLAPGDEVAFGNSHFSVE